MTKKSVCLGFMAFDVAFDLPAKETLGWRGAAKPLLLLEQLTMAHNQDRLQNSDSSVVYGHGHIIYSHTASRCSLQSDVGDTPLRQAIKQPTMSLNGPPQKHISVYLLVVAELRRRSEKGMHSFALTFLRTRSIHQFVSGTEFDASGRSSKPRK